MTKKRVHEIAKEWGMTGQDLAAELRGWGLTHVKSHMTALDDSEVMVIEGRLEAYGRKRSGDGAAPAGTAELPGLIKRKKKKVEEPAAEEPAARAAPAPAPAPAPPTPRPEPVPKAPAPDAAAEAPPPKARPARTAKVVEEAVETAAPAPAAEAEVAPAPAPPPPKHSEPKPAELRAADVREATLPEPPAPPPTRAAPPPPPSPPQQQPQSVAEARVRDEAPPAAPPPPAPRPSLVPESTKVQGTEDEIVRPGAARRAGKVVGFVDLSKHQPSTPPPKRESRRLRSADDEAAPNVQPTLGKDRRKAFTRGSDAQRTTLSAQEMREREAGRVLRTGGPNRPGAGGRGPGGPRMGGGLRGGGARRPMGSGSPFAGQLVQVEAPVTVKQLARAIALKEGDVLRKSISLLGFGAVNINSTLDEDTAVLLAAEFGVELEVTQAVAAEDTLLASLAAKRSKIEEEELVLRPPTVAVLGHVDHGKTTLIDTIRRSQIAQGESGGITQHIGAYQVTTKAGHRVTIIDTPGHAAFTAMRARGARAVDIVILVVAADDGVMPQTEEAINHARAAKVPIVVAVNKMDKPEANPERVMNELAAKELIPEEWGGPTAMLKVSALKGDGIDELLERVFLEGEILDLKAHPKGPAMGVVLEAEVHEGRGKIAHLLIQDGSLKRGDVILAGEGYGNVRSMRNDRGETITEAGPATPVEVTGLDVLPTIGERFYVVESLDAAQEVATERARANRQMSLVERKAVNRENLFQAVAESQKKSVNLVVKADVQGSLEVLKAQLAAMQHEEVEVKLIDAGVGAVSESNVDLAISSDATILAFHVATSPKARQNAERGGVEIRNYTVLYELLDDVRKMMEGTLSPEIYEEITGHVEIRRLFRSSKLGNIAGSHVIDGKVSRDSRIRLIRDGNVVWTGQIGSLRREKDEAKDVREGFDCGIVLKNYDDIREGDILEAFRMLERRRKI